MSGDVDPRRVSAVRPWGLRGLRPVPQAGVPVYRYDPVRQVALTSGGELWVNSEEGKTWSSILELDGDEGRSEDWGWDEGKDVTEGW
ncbi:MAG TPA: putative ATP-grasp-modified RiPP [Pseudonocardiaceae bacterium]|nr:putative ATP-grasp-modified RiPP [Pseudonocardiaceae bacterium]